MKEDNKNIENEFYLSKWICGELTDAELKNFVSEEDFITYKKMLKGINVYSELEKPLDNSFKKIQSRIKTKPKVRKLNIGWIAAVAAVLLLFFGIYNMFDTDLVNSSTSFGEQKTVVLLDGSKVTLNAKSSLHYSSKKWKLKREVFLDGEAFFKVKKGQKFTVNTNNGNVTVLGTQFTVNATDDYFEVVCYEGSVRVTSNDVAVILKPKEFYRNTNAKTVENLLTSAVRPTWISGESNYRSVPLKYVITDFEKQYNVGIDATSINKDALFTGSFSHKNLNLALKSVFDPMQITYHKTKNNKLILEQSN